jgi:hypothetical protein
MIHPPVNKSLTKLNRPFYYNVRPCSVSSRAAAQELRAGA